MKKEALKKKIDQLEKELKLLKQELCEENNDPSTVLVPEDLQDAFKHIEDKIRHYFSDLNIDPESGEITAQGQRYVLLRSDSLSHEFIDFIVERYADRPKHEAISIGNNFLYDNAKVIGTRDAVAFHNKLGLSAPIEKLSAGPIHFAFTGWANVEILADSNPSPDENFLLKFIHHNSFEAQSWIKSKKKTEIPEKMIVEELLKILTTLSQSFYQSPFLLKVSDMNKYEQEFKLSKNILIILLD